MSRPWHRRTSETRRAGGPESWSLFDSKWDWRGWLDTTFAQVATQQLGGLVVDLRANEGGLDCGDEIVARLIDAPVLRSRMRRLVRYRRVADDLRPYLDTWDKSFFDWGNDAQPFDTSYYTLSSDNDKGADANVIRPKGPRFHGKVVVLIGPENSSATFQFAALLQRERLGVLVGEETGGNLRGINGGAFFFLRLPQSALEADLPLIGTFPIEDMPDRGLQPDVEAPDTPASIAAGEDPALSRGLAIASS